MLRRVLLLFFASGALGLGYQVLWSKLVLLFVGVSSWSYAIVLAAFMTGLALGSHAMGRVADRVRSPLALFGWLELGIAACAIAYPSLSALASRLYLSWAADSAVDAGATRIGLKCIAAGVLLIPPTFLMGGTYPALLRHATIHLGAVGRRASQLYAANAAGAVLGSLLMAMLLLPSLGIQASLMLLALGNATIGGFALLAARRETSAGARDQALASSLPDERFVVSPVDDTVVPLGTLVVIVAFVAGFLSFTLEIAWTRAFAIALGSSTQSFAVILAAFITGITVGSAVLTRFESRIQRPVAVFGGLQVLTGFLVVLPLPVMPFLPWILGRIARDMPASDAGYQAWAALRLAACLSIMLLPCLGLGLSIPLLVKAAVRSTSAIAARGGQVYAYNALGNVLGALVAGMVLLPLLGVERLIETSGIALALVGAAAFVAGSPRAGSRARLVQATAAVIAIVAMAVTLPRWNPAWLTVESFRREQVADWSVTRSAVSSRDVAWMHDDPAANVMVLRGRGENADKLSLLVNGKPDASTHGDQPTQLLLAHLPLVLAPEAKEVLVIGLATGITSGAVLKHPVERLDVVDIVASMPAAAAWFDDWSGRPLEDPRTTFIADDARSWLLSTTRKYDVVISEPSNPWTAGTGSLFSTEFYEHASRRLTDGGIYVQWLQAYELSDETLGAILRSFRRTFPHATLWETASRDVLLVGSGHELIPDASIIERAMARPGVVSDLAGLGITLPEQVLFLQRLSTPSIDWIAAASSLENTDDNLLLEHAAPRDLFLLRSPTELMSQDERRSVSPLLGWSGRIRAGAGDPLRLPEVMTGRVFGTSDMLRSWIAGLERAGRAAGNEDAIERLRQALPAGANEPAAGAGALAAAIHAAASDGDLPRLSRLLATERSSLLVAALLEPQAADGILGVLQAASDRASGRAQMLLSLMQVDTLIAAGRMQEATARLAGLQDVRPPPEPEELLQRACRIDQGAGCDAAARGLLAATGNARFERFLDLRGANARR